MRQPPSAEQSIYFTCWSSLHSSLCLVPGSLCPVSKMLVLVYLLTGVFYAVRMKGRFDEHTEMILFTVFCLSLCGLYVYSLWIYSYWKSRKVPYPKPVPLFGNVKDIVFLKQYPGHRYQQIYEMFPEEKAVGMFQLHRPCLLLRDPELVKQCLVRDFDHFTDRGFHVDEGREPLTGNLVNLTGERWKALRAKLTPAFSSGKIKQMLPLVQLCSSQLRRFIQDQMETTDVIEMREAMARFTTDVIGTVAFGLQFEAMQGDSVFREMGKKALEPSGMGATAKAMRIFTPWLFDLLRMRTFPREVNEFFTRVVRDTMDERLKQGYQRNDFLQLMMQLREQAAASQEDFPFTEQVIAAQAFIFFLAGFETSSTTLSYCLYELAKWPAHQERVYQEIREMYATYGEVTYEGLAGMNFLEQALLETMRMYPPVGNLARVCTKEYRLPNSDVTLEKGVSLVVPVYALHHDPALWPRPESFEPERFADRDLQKAPYYLPFGAGPRLCIGQRFAMLEMKVALLSLVQDFTFSLGPDCPESLEVDPKSFIMAPTAGIWLRVTPRVYQPQPQDQSVMTHL